MGSVRPPVAVFAALALLVVAPCARLQRGAVRTTAALVRLTAVVGVGRVDAGVGTVRPAAPVRALAAVYAGATSEGERLAIAIDPRRQAVTALRFTIAYACTGRPLTLRALILRPDDAWAVIARWPTPRLGFSDWFSGPIGHDFHITGTLSADQRAMTGTLHSLLPRAAGHGRCDSGRLSFRASAGPGPFAGPPLSTITRRQYRALPAGITLAAAERRLGPPDDRDAFLPAGVIAGTIPSVGLGGTAQAWLDYAWRGHGGRYFQFLFRDGRLLPGGAGRSVIRWA